ncbi:MAG: amino acid adenylation domain-containing protein [Synergistaceae bacterium]|nr:amino acid adenylation domain-containing protein [Synergistaceae bacterium]
MKHIIETFLQTVKDHGAEPAISDDNGTFTYNELCEFAKCVAANLQKNGVRYGSRVIVEIPRSKEYGGCLIGCWIMGAVAIPLSDDYPEERLNYIKQDSQYDLCIDENFMKSMDMSLRVEPIISEMDAEGIVIYTSGSTGNPKGVVHDFYSMAAVAARNTIHDKEEKTERNNIVGLVAPFTFVVGTGLFIAALPLAKHIVIVPDEIRKDPYKLAKYYDDNDIEASFVPPRIVNFMLKHNKSLKIISVGSERITNIYFNDHPVVMNGYGATELFGGTLGFKIDKLYENTPIGKPFGTEKAYVLDENNNQVEIGELCIAGYVAKGYLNRPEETKKAFVKNPFTEIDGYERMFRTGDIVQRLPDGNLVFIERKDWIIKINGQRVEPLEVETTVRRFPGIKEAAVKDFTAKNGVTYLAIYYVADEGVTEEKLREHCKTNLPHYMVPSFYTKMEVLPLNPNGKLDRKNLPEPDIASYKREYVAPQNKIEEAICHAIEEVLQCGRIGRDDDFFLLGGDSIKAIETINALEDLPIDLEKFFEGKTPAKIAELIENGGSDEIPFERVQKAAYPLTSSQLGVYFAVEENPKSLMYNNPISITLGENVNVAKLAAAVEKTVANHKAYQCNIDVVGGVPCMIPNNRKFKLECRKTNDMQTELQQFIKPFDLANGELIRACIFESNEEKVLALDAHHIVFDGTTLSILLKEISRAYGGYDLFEERTSAFDLSTYEEVVRTSQKYDDAKTYYKQMFDGLELSNDFPSDFKDKGEAKLDTVECKLSLERDKLLKFLKSNNFTEHSLFLSAFAFVLAKFNGTDQSLVCVAESGRHTSMTFNTAGMLVKTIALPVDLKGESDITRYIRKMQEMFRKNTKNDVYPFAELATEYGISNDFMFVYQNDAFNSLTLCGEQFPVIGIPNPDAINKLTLMAFYREDGYRLSFRYRSDLYSRGIIESFADAFVCAVSEFVKKEYLKEVSLVSEHQATLLDTFNNNEMPLEDKTITEGFNEWVSKTPEHEFVVYKENHYSYGQAGKITDKIAAKIQSLGFSRNDIVAILVPRNEWIILAPLGVLKAGCAYEPLDISYPEERLSFMVKDAKAKLLITTRELKDKISGYNEKFLFIEDLENLPEATPTPVKNELDDLFILLYTSGTTGNPKGVMLSHGNVTALSQLNKRMFKIDGEATNACYASFGFDACMQDIISFPPYGGVIHVIPEEIRLDLSEVNRYYTENKITHGFMSTQVGRQFATFTKTPYLKYLMVGGEALIPIDTDKLSFEFRNHYGPTECTAYVTNTKVESNTYKTSIGKVNANIKGYIVDANMNRLPVGAPGELLVSGRQIGKGYLNLPEKTADAFIKNPFTNEKSYKTIYRTGDIVRYLPDGTIDFIGRHDGQVKIRGFRVELTEIEEIIRRFSGIKDATVAAFDDPAGGKFIAAYVVSDEEINIRRLNEFILSEKPSYMVPAVTMQIEAIPLNQNQKVNKRALPKPERKVALVIAPKNDTQKKLHDIITEILGQKEISIDADLYETGLTSISIIRLNVELEKTFNIPFKVADIKANSSIEKLATFIESSTKEVEYELLPDYPITQTQMGIYIECSANPNSVLYNIPLLLKLGKNVDTKKLIEAAKTVINAHPYVKTTLFANAEGNIRARRNDEALPQIDFIKCEELPGHEKLVKPFTLLNEPLYRIAIYETSNANYLFLDFHHIISDGMSENILLYDINKVYAGLLVEKEKYTGFEVALDEEAARNTEHYASAKSYYDSVFKGCDPACLPPKATQTDAKGSATLERLSKISYKDVKAYCDKHRVTQNAFFNTAFGYTLSRFGNFEDTIYTTIYNGRSDSRLSRSISMLVKTLPVLVHTGGSRIITDMILETQEQLINNMSNDIFSFAEISAAYGIKSDVIFAYQGDEFSFDSLAGEPVEVINPAPAGAKAPIVLNVYLANGQYRLVSDFRLEHYSPDFIECFLDVFEMTLKGFIEKTKTNFISLISEKSEALLSKINETKHPFENVSVNRLFEHFAKTTPDCPAVICEDRKLTYKELNTLANRMAHRLIEEGVKKDTVVGMMLPRSEKLSISEIAIFKSGGAFLGLLPDYPDDRIDYCLRDAGSPLVITTKDILESRQVLFSKDKPYRALIVDDLVADGNEENPNLDIPTNSLAYCIYTSGSTGNPKGVMIEHHSLANLAQPADSVYKYYHGNMSGHVSLALSSVSFDASILDHMLMLLNGKTVCLATEREIHNPLLLADVISKHKVDIMMTTPSLLTNLLSISEFRPVMANVKSILVGAETFPTTLYDSLKELSPEITIINAYGPTECTVTCSAKKLDSAENITIGGPMVNAKIYVVDKFGNILPPYACGELLIVGECVGRGYINLPDKTKEVFSTFDGLPAYHSGDLVRLNKDGEIEFFGRRDNQVKLRGFRVELDEIENCINAFEGITRSKVVVRNNGSEDYLVGFYSADHEINSEALIAHMRSRLTYYMVPDVMMQLDAMPLTPSGKIDKKALPEVKREKKRSGRKAPRKSIEQELCELFASVLSLDEFYADDNFFEMGGTSLSASKVTMQLMARGIRVEYQNIFDNPTPELLANYIASHNKAYSISTEGTNEDTSGIRSDYPEQLQYNTLEYADQVERKPLGDVLLTGAVGFLGIHVLRELIDANEGHIVCLIRRGSFATPLKRLKSMLMYYFDEIFTEALEKRIQVLEADITGDNLVNVLKDVHFDTIINCAACVKHYAADDIIERINVHGVENLIKVATKHNAKLIQVSTISVYGAHTEETWRQNIKAYENKLFVIDDMGNKYGISKYHAELKMLEAIKNGMRGKIIRVGNLMGRQSDGEFQINFNSNAFLNALRGFATIGKAPISHSTDQMSFSPIDMTARAVVLLSGTNDMFTAFNADNRFIFDEWQLVAVANRCGVKITPVADREYYADYHRMLGDLRINARLQGLITNDRPDIHGVEVDNKFTTNILYRLGFSWPLPSDDYLERAIRSLLTIDYFELDEN